MSKAEWERTYQDAWKTYYTNGHIETVLRRAIATGTSPGKTTFFITWFKGCIGIEGIHPLEGGFFRRKMRTSRRSSMPLESPLIFYPKYFIESVKKQFQWISLYLRLRMIYLRVRKDPTKLEYLDTALEPVTEHEEEREMFQSDAARTYLEKVHHIESVRQGVRHQI